MKIIKIFLLLSWNGRVVDGGHLRRKWDLSSSFPPLRAAFADTFFFLLFFVFFFTNFRPLSRAPFREVHLMTHLSLLFGIFMYVCVCIFIGFWKNCILYYNLALGYLHFAQNSLLEKFSLVSCTTLKRK